MNDSNALTDNKSASVFPFHIAPFLRFDSSRGGIDPNTKENGPSSDEVDPCGNGTDGATAVRLLVSKSKQTPAHRHRGLLVSASAGDFTFVSHCVSLSQVPPQAKSEPVADIMNEILELRVNSLSVRLYPEAPQTITDDAVAVAVMTPGPTSPPTPSICLLSGPLEDFRKLARHEASKWLIDLAHDICDPAQQRGSLVVWEEPEQQWNLVTSTDPLTASIYRYDLPEGTTVGLSKISQREGRSKTKGDENASAMHDRVVSRDGRCWVTGVNEPVVNGHICPKRMGDHIARVIFETFTSLSLPPNLSIYDEIFGICLSRNIDSFFDDYEMGFRYVSPGNYECHTFAILAPGERFTILGRIHVPTNLSLPPLHGYPAAPPCPQSNNNPPAGLFRWHYLQCVLKRFAHEDYKSLDNIHLFELPLPMAGDSDDEGTDSELEWPSKGFDFGRVVVSNLREREERNHSVATWIKST